MALETQNVPIEFSGGLDTKTDQKLVVPGKLTLLENGIFTHQTIQKRNGYLNLSQDVIGGSDLTDPQSLGSFKDELVQFAGNNIYSRSSSNDAWINKGRAYSLNVGNENVARNSSQQTNADIAYKNGVYVSAWQDSRGGVRASVVEESSGTQFQSDVSLNSTAIAPKCIAIGNYLFVIYSDGTDLLARRVDPLSPLTFSAELTIGSDFNSSNPYFDADVSGLKAVIVYRSSTTIKVKYFTQEGTVGTTTVGLPNPITISESPTDALAVSVEPTTLNVYVFWFNSTNGLRLQVFYPDFTSYLAKTTLDAGVSPVVLRITAYPTSAHSYQVFYEKTATNSYDHYIKSVTVTDTGTVGTPAILKRSVGLYGKAFSVNASTYFVAAYQSVLQSTYFIIGADGSIAGKILSETAGGLPVARQVSNSVLISDTEIVLATLKKNKFVSEGSTTFTLTGVTKSTIDFDSNSSFISRELDGNLHILGSYLSIYDGMSVVEHGYHLFPEGIAATPHTTGGNVADGTYEYFVVYEWTDNQGQIHRSAPSVGLSVTVSGGAGSGKVSLTIPTLRLTEKTGVRNEVNIVIYRTLVGAATAHKITDTLSPLENDLSVDSVSYDDTSADSTIEANQVLYTSGGVLENIAAPPVGSLDIYKNRVVLVPSEDLLSVWYSKVKVQGEGVQFNDSLFFRVDPLGGSIVAPKMMDDKIILFKHSNIFAVAGDGPNDLGQNNDFTTPALVTSDVGCTEPKSIVLMPLGIMFKSEKGIYLLDRSLQVYYIGNEVEDFNSQSITSATLIQDKNQVRFLTSEGVTLVYDYFYKQWSTFTNHEGLAAAIWEGSYSYLRSSGEVYVEGEDHFLDNNVEIRLRIATAWIKMAGIQGYQRIRRALVLGNYKSSHILRMKIGYDYEETYPDVVLFQAGDVLDQNYYGQDSYFGESAVYGGVSDNIYQFRAHLRRQKCQSIRFLFEDVTSGTPGEGYSLSNLSLEVGIKQGLMKLRAAKSVG